MSQIVKLKMYADDCRTEDFYKTEFMKKEVTTSKSLKLGALTNRIHPLFEAPLEAGISGPSVVHQSARLASHFITCGVLDNTFRTITSGKSHIWMNP